MLANDSDPQGLTLTAMLYQNVSDGTLTLQPDGLFSYTPNQGFVGQDSFTYEATDGTYTSDPATVTITVTPHSPGSTMAGGVGFQGPGAAASNDYGAVSGNAGSFSAGAGTPDNFDPTFNGPGLSAPGVYAAGFNGAGSQLASFFGPNATAPSPALSGGQSVSDPYYSGPEYAGVYGYDGIYGLYGYGIYGYGLYGYGLPLELELLYSGSFSTSFQSGDTTWSYEGSRDGNAISASETVTTDEQNGTVNVESFHAGSGALPTAMR